MHNRDRLRFVVVRVLTLVPVLFVVGTVAFFLMRAVPGGPFDNDVILPVEVEANIRAKYALDQPLLHQYADYLSGLLRGDLGPSLKYPDRTVNEIVQAGFLVSLQLGLLTLMLALIFGIVAGTLSGLYHNRWPDYFVMTASVFGLSVPNIVLGPLLVLLFGLALGLLPVAGWGTWQDLILPSVTLCSLYVAFFSRLIRSGTIDAFGQDFVATARAKGVSPFGIVVKHVLPHSVLPAVTYFGPAAASILTGSMVVESIFHIPGLGQHFVNSALNRDYTLAMGTILFYAVLLVVVNTMVDIIYTFLDPRVRVS